MAEENKKPKTDYVSNSSKSKKESSESPERPVVQQITAGRVVKKSLGTKFKETFAGDTAESVGQYILFDVIIPRIKDMLYDTVSQGFERALFGTSTRTNRTRKSTLVNKTDYSGISSSGARQSEQPLSDRARANHLFEEVRIETRGEAEQVLDTLTEIADRYDSATVADFYNAVGYTSSHTDLKYGWEDLSEARIVPARGGGYFLDLPRAQPL